MKVYLAGLLPDGAPICPRTSRPSLLGVGEPCPPGLILSAFTLETADGRTIAWPSSMKEAIHYAGWYACSHHESVHVVEGGKPVAMVKEKIDA